MLDIVREYITPLEDLPVGSGSEPPKRPLLNVSVQGARNTAFYTAHSYHTKVPPEAITPFLCHFTEPGDVVLDPFCGSGMTGVAAAMAGRRSILSDLSPAAAHLSWNHTNPCDPADLARAFEDLASELREPINTLYETRHVDGSKGVINWMMWSTKHQCPRCQAAFLLWDAIDKKSGRLGSVVSCPKCGGSATRRSLINLGSEPAWVSYRTSKGKLFQRAATKDDLRRALAFDKAAIKEWFPSVKLGPDREMYVRCALQLKNIESVADLYTARNLMALSLMWKAINEVKNRRLKLALAFAFTNTAWHGTRMRRFNARGGQRPLTGTLYIPQLSSEVNVLEVMRNKIRQLSRYFVAYQPAALPPAILNESATNLSTIRSGSIDYVFTDPPFGSNIFYGDCNLIWESWLGRVTDVTKEAVINRSIARNLGSKTIDHYRKLMTDAMSEIYRALKPKGWATIVFHNTDAAVWAALQKAAESAGFEFHEASSLDRKQQSHKGYKGRDGKENVAHFDVIMNLRKSATRITRRSRGEDRKLDSLERMLKEIANDPSIAIRGLQGAHAEVMRRQASLGDAEFYSYSEVRSVWANRILQEQN